MCLYFPSTFPLHIHLLCSKKKSRQNVGNAKIVLSQYRALPQPSKLS